MYRDKSRCKASFSLIGKIGEKGEIRVAILPSPLLFTSPFLPKLETEGEGNDTHTPHFYSEMKIKTINQ